MITVQLQKSVKIQWVVLAIMLSVSYGCSSVTISPSEAKVQKNSSNTASKTKVDKLLPWDAKVEKLLKEASAFEMNGDLANSVEYLKIAITIDPSNTTVHGELNRLVQKRNNVAEKYFNEGNSFRNSNIKEAIKNYLSALSVRSDYPEALSALRELQLSRTEATLKARLKKEAAHASSKTQGKVQSDYDDIDASNYSLEFAVLSFEDGDFMTAIREFEKIRSRYPNDKDIILYLNSSYYNVGISWFLKNEYQKALSWFIRVKKGFERVDENIRKCRQNLKGLVDKLFSSGLILYQEHKYIDAVAQWKAVLEIDPVHKQSKEYMKKANKKIHESSKKSK